MSRNLLSEKLRNNIYRVGKAGFIWCHGTPSIELNVNSVFSLEKPVLFDVTEPISVNFSKSSKIVGKAGFIWCHGTKYIFIIFFIIVGKAGFIWCHGTTTLVTVVWSDVIVGKAGFIWCHGTPGLSSSCRHDPCWKSRFYLMSRNIFHLILFFRINMLEKPVLFDVTELMFWLIINLPYKVGKAGFIWCHGTIQDERRPCLLLEKPVLFDVTEPRQNGTPLKNSAELEKPVLFDVTELDIERFIIIFRRLEKPVLFDVTEQIFFKSICYTNTLEKPVLFDVTEHLLLSIHPNIASCWKSRFYLMSRNLLISRTCGFSDVGKAGFIWCHGTELPEVQVYQEKVGKAGFIWCHGTQFLVHFLGIFLALEKPVLFDVTERIGGLIRYDPIRWKSRFYLMSRNSFGFSYPSWESCWKSRFYLMSRNNYIPFRYFCTSCWKSRFYLMSRNLFLLRLINRYGWKSRFYLMSRNRTPRSSSVSGKGWKSRFYLMSRNAIFGSFSWYISGVGKAGFIWCHGTDWRADSIWSHPLEKPVLFDVTELFRL